jgi:AcrR family transcriptional regulator
MEGLRQRNRARTREAIVEAALELFRARGYRQVTVDEIARQAGVARRTVFRYFATKEDLVLFDHGDYVATFRRVLEERPARERPFRALRRAARAVAGELQQNRTQLLPRLRLVAKEPALRARYVELDQRWHEAIVETLAPFAASDDAELRLRLIAGAVVGALNAGLTVWVRRGGRLDLEAAVDRVFDLLQNGLGEVLP